MQTAETAISLKEVELISPPFNHVRYAGHTLIANSRDQVVEAFLVSVVAG